MKGQTSECSIVFVILLLLEHPDEQPHNNTIDIDIEVAADNDRHDSQMITQDISDDDNDDANADEDDDDDDDVRNHGESCFLRCLLTVCPVCLMPVTVLEWSYKHVT